MPAHIVQSILRVWQCFWEAVWCNPVIELQLPEQAERDEAGHPGVLVPGGPVVGNQGNGKLQLQGAEKSGGHCVGGGKGRENEGL